MSSSDLPDGVPPQNDVRRLRRPAPDTSLDAAVNWLSSGELSDEEREAISRGTEASATKMSAFQHVLAASRAGRLARFQGWLGSILEVLLDPPAGQELNAYYWLQVAQLMRQLQEDDTKFVQSVSKNTDQISANDVRKLLSGGEETPENKELMDNISKVAPHIREKLRKLFEIILAEDKNNGGQNKA